MLIDTHPPWSNHESLCSGNRDTNDRSTPAPPILYPSTSCPKLIYVGAASTSKSPTKSGWERRSNLSTPCSLTSALKSSFPHPSAPGCRCTAWFHRRTNTAALFNGVAGPTACTGYEAEPRSMWREVTTRDPTLLALLTPLNFRTPLRPQTYTCTHSEHGPRGHCRTIIQHFRNL